LVGQPSATQASLVPDYDDANTGIGHAANDQLSLIAGAFEVARVADTAPNLTFNATVDAASTEVVRVAGPDRATPADNDEAYISFNLEDSAAFDEFARISAVATDVTTTEEDGALTFDIVVAGGDAEAMRLVSDGTDGTQLILPSANDPVLPTLAFGDADSGLYEYTEDGISFAFSGAEVWAFNALSLGASTTACDVGGECVWLDTIPVTQLPARCSG
jgi:hypothetical protein